MIQQVTRSAYLQVYVVQRHKNLIASRFSGTHSKCLLCTHLITQYTFQMKYNSMHKFYLHISGMVRLCGGDELLHSRYERKYKHDFK